MSLPMITVDHVSMRYNLYKERVDSLKEYLIRLSKRQISSSEFWALKDVNLTVRRGESWGLVGVNGSGKSTLLKLIASVLKPTKGRIVVGGTIAPMIELGAGFDIDLTARENIFLNGAVLGYSNMEMKERYQAIVDFSELHEFVDVPIKNFSSGMLARLGFSIATISDPDILIIDEILSVGDFAFQRKCENRIQELIDRQTTILFVSHSISQVKSICRNALWLDKGTVRMSGDVETVCQAYVEEVAH